MPTRELQPPTIAGFHDNEETPVFSLHCGQRWPCRERRRICVLNELEGEQYNSTPTKKPFIDSFENAIVCFKTCQILNTINGSLLYCDWHYACTTGVPSHFLRWCQIQSFRAEEHCRGNYGLVAGGSGADSNKKRKKWGQLPYVPRDQQQLPPSRTPSRF